MMKRIFALIRARNLEFFRDRSALAWNIIFPLLVILGFGFGFGNSKQAQFKVSYLSLSQDFPTHPFFKTEYLSFHKVEDVNEGLDKLNHHKVDLFINLSEAPLKYWINQSSPKGYIVEKILLASGAPPSNELIRSSIDTKEIRYVDWLIAGMLGMNMMFSSLFGVGYSIVRYRKNGVLKRLKATPITAFEFLSSQIASRIFINLSMSAIIFFGAKVLINFSMMGSYPALLLCFFAGSLCLISLGLLCVTAVKSEELAGGLLQLCSWPMMFLSGVWFSLEGFSQGLKSFAKLLPLTHFVDSARAVMNEGASFTQVSPHIASLFILSFIFLGISSYFFKWE